MNIIFELVGSELDSDSKEDAELTSNVAQLVRTSILDLETRMSPSVAASIMRLRE
jgi:hypothetical protein